MNAIKKLPTPTQTLSIMSQLLHQELDTAERLETEIEEIISELNDEPNDYRQCRLVMDLTCKRAAQSAHVARCAEYVKTVDLLRVQNGMEVSVLGRVMKECGK